MSQPKEDLLRNAGYVVISQKHSSALFFKDEGDIKRMLFRGEISEGDVIIQLTEETVKVAVKYDEIKLQ